MDQNTQINPPSPSQSVSENPQVPQPISVGPENQSKKYIVVACILLVILLLGGLWYLFAVKNNSGNVSMTTYFSPEPATSASPSPSDLTEEEASMDASLKQLDSDQKSIDQAVNDKSDNFDSL